MISRWLCVRIRAAERALSDGRIDEAFVTAADPEVRNHRRGQKLLDELVGPLLARARLHLQAGRVPQAAEDLDRIEALGRAAPEIQELRQRVAERLREQHQQTRKQQQALANAVGALDAGRLDTGRLAIERVPDVRQRENLREQLDIRVQRGAQLLDQARAALERGDVLTAVRFWQDARERHGCAAESDEFASRLASAFRHSLDEWFAQGRLERLLAARPGLSLLSECDPMLTEYEQLAGLCLRGAEQLGGCQFSRLRETILRLKAARPHVSWLDELLGSLGQIATAHEALLASPFGLFASAVRPGQSEAAADPGDRGATPRTAPGPDAAALLLHTSPVLLLVDGAGSVLLVPQDTVRIGRAGGSRPVDVPIPGDIQSHHADIIRDGEDYFLAARGPVSVNQREAKRTVLRDGDRIELGPAVRLGFRKPSAKSDSAVLQLSHRCRLPLDVSQVVLFRETCLVGPSASCHIRTPGGPAQVVLFERDGRLYGREATARGGKLGDARPIRLDQTMDFGEVRLTATRYASPEEPVT